MTFNNESLHEAFLNFAQYLNSMQDDSDHLRDALSGSSIRVITSESERSVNLINRLTHAIVRDWGKWNFSTLTGEFSTPCLVVLRHGKRLFSPSSGVGNLLLDFFRSVYFAPIDFVWGEQLRGMPAYAHLQDGDKPVLDLLDDILAEETKKPWEKSWEYDSRYDSFLIIFNHANVPEEKKKLLDAVKNMRVAYYASSTEESCAMSLYRFLACGNYDSLNDYADEREGVSEACCEFVKPNDDVADSGGRLLIPYNFDRASLKESSKYFNFRTDELWQTLPLGSDLKNVYAVAAIFVDDDEHFLKRWQEESGAAPKPCFDVSTVLSTTKNGNGVTVGEKMDVLVKKICLLTEKFFSENRKVAVIIDRLMPAPGESSRHNETTSLELYRLLSEMHLIVPWLTSISEEGIPGAYLINKKYDPADIDALIEELCRGLLLRPAIQRIMDEIKWNEMIKEKSAVEYVRAGCSTLYKYLGRKDCNIFWMIRQFSGHKSHNMVRGADK